MKKFCFFILLCTSFLVQAQDTLTILHMNDTHSSLAPIGPRKADLSAPWGGIARAATIINEVKSNESKVLTLHSGDVYLGDIFFNKFFGAAEFQLLNSLGLDAMVLGNHEFDLFPSTLEAALKGSFTPETGFSILSANAIFKDDTSYIDLRKYLKGFTVKEFEHLKVGIFGLTTPEVNFLSQPENIFIDTNIVEAALFMVDTLKKLDCDVVVLLSHLGLYYDKIMASYVSGLNLIVSGHDHTLLNEPLFINNVPIVQVQPNYLNLGELKFLINPDTVKFINYRVINLDENVAEELIVKSIVEQLIAAVEIDYGPMFTQKLAYVTETFYEEPENLYESGHKDTPLGSLVTKAFMDKTKTDLVICVSGSTSQPLYKGPITQVDVFRAFGYGFNEVNTLGYRVATYKLTGEEISKALGFCLSQVNEVSDFLPQVRGMKYEYNLNNPPDERLVSLQFDSLTFYNDSLYSITSNEFLVGALMQLLNIMPKDLYLYEALTEFEVLRDYIAAHPVLTPEITQNITDAKDNDEVIKDFNIYQNYPNPFNPTTSIDFELPSNEKVSVVVYDMLGNQIDVLVNGELKAGKQSLKWNAINYSSGIYFYKINAGKFSKTMKMILMK